MCTAPTTRLGRFAASWRRNTSQLSKLAIKPAPAGFIFSRTPRDRVVFPFIAPDFKIRRWRRGSLAAFGVWKFPENWERRDHLKPACDPPTRSSTQRTFHLTTPSRASTPAPSRACAHDYHALQSHKSCSRGGPGAVSDSFAPRRFDTNAISALGWVGSVTIRTGHPSRCVTHVCRSKPGMRTSAIDDKLPR